MIDTSALMLFLPASLLLIIAPGPDIIFLISQGVSRGRKAGTTTAMGLATGNLVHTLDAVLGISVIFRTSALAFQILKFAGAAYLLYLACKTLRERKKAIDLENTKQGNDNFLFGRGFLMNILNPKVALFFLAFLPQFASPELGPVWLQVLFLGVLFTFLVILVFGAVGLFAGTLGRWLKGQGGPKFNTYVSWTVAVVYASLAARLVLIER